MPVNESTEDSVKPLLTLLRKGLLDGTFSMTQAMGLADKIADEAKKAGLPEDGWYRLKSHLSDFLLSCQAEKDQQPTPSPRTSSNQEDIPWQKRQPWATIKTYLPPAMIDTDEKERSVAWRIGFLLGYSAEKAMVAAIREYGIAGGVATVALFAWAYDYMKRNP